MLLVICCFLIVRSGKKKKTCLPVQETQEKQVQSLGQEDTLEKGMATCSSILAWTEELGGLQPIGLQRVKHNSSNLACMHTVSVNG